jgi:hypothetical protein
MFEIALTLRQLVELRRLEGGEAPRESVSRDLN